MIQMQPNARYVILGEDRAHASLTELVRYHQSVGIKPFMEILTVPCGQVNVEDLQPGMGMGYGLCPERAELLQQHLFCILVWGVPFWTSSLASSACTGKCYQLGTGESWGGREALVGGQHHPFPKCQQWAQLDISLWVCGGSASQC